LEIAEIKTVGHIRPRKTYSGEQLSIAFDSVKNKDHWKNPIDAIINVTDMDIVSEAIIYFTATEAEFGKPKDGKVRVRAIGYYMGPAGP